ncbi:MAG: Proline iminopeptidase [uncultured Clostridium sp.]
MIEVKEYINIRNVEQYILIAGNENGPLMLFLHGGPGVSQIGFIRKYQHKLERDFLVVNWDQRGAGKSNKRKFSKDELTIDNIVEDTISLIQILLNRFGKNKLFLVGHSFGSLIGILVSKKIPNFINAFISIGQVVNIDKGDKMIFNLLLKKINKDNYQKGLKILHRIGIPPYNDKNKINKFNKLIKFYKGDIFRITKISFILKSISFKYYNLFDWFKFLKGIIVSNQYMYSEMAKINLFNEINSIDIPIYFCCGDNDYCTPTKLIEEYYNFINAPKKAIYKFKCSSHMPNIEEELCFYNMCKIICKDNE